MLGLDRGVAALLGVFPILVSPMVISLVSSSNALVLKNSPAMVQLDLECFFVVRHCRRRLVLMRSMAAISMLPQKYVAGLASAPALI